MQLFRVKQHFISVICRKAPILHTRLGLVFAQRNSAYASRKPMLISN